MRAAGEVPHATVPFVREGQVEPTFVARSLAGTKKTAFDPAGGSGAFAMAIDAPRRGCRGGAGD